MSRLRKLLTTALILSLLTVGSPNARAQTAIDTPTPTATPMATPTNAPQPTPVEAPPEPTALPTDQNLTAPLEAQSFAAASAAGPTSLDADCTDGVCVFAVLTDTDDAGTDPRP